MRIAKFLSAAGICSRREAERIISAGGVRINDISVVDPSVRVSNDDKVFVLGRICSIEDNFSVWMHFKKPMRICSSFDYEGRRLVYDDLPAIMPRVVSVGRLDFMSEGLILFSNNPALAHFLEKPSTGFKRKYEVISYSECKRIKSGLRFIYGEKYHFDKINCEKLKEGSRFEITISEGKNREIRNLMHSEGIRIKRLCRLSYGPFNLGKLKPGETTEYKYDTLKKILPDFFDVRKQ